MLSATKTGVSASYVYDGLHRQIQKTVASTNTRYYYAGWQRLADYNGTTLQNRYVYGASVDEALIEVSSAGVASYMHADRLGSVIAITNSAGDITAKFAYGPYGETNSAITSSIGYTGQRYDAETGLYFYKRRQYSTVIGRFLQPDPLGIAYSDLNLNSYVLNDPLNFVDQLGCLQSDPTNGIAIGGGPGVTNFSWNPPTVPPSIVPPPIVPPPPTTQPIVPKVPVPKAAPIPEPVPTPKPIKKPKKCKCIPVNTLPPTSEMRSDNPSPMERVNRALQELYPGHETLIDRIMNFIRQYTGENPGGLSKW